MRKYFSDPEARRRQSEAANAWWDAHPEAREAQAERNRRRFADPEARRRVSERSKAAWARRKGE